MAAPEVTLGLKVVGAPLCGDCNPDAANGTGIFTSRHFPLFMWPFFTFHVGKQSIDLEHLGFRESDPKMA